MPKLTYATKHILMAIWSLDSQKQPADLKGILEHNGWTKWEKDAQALSAQLECLVGAGYVTCQNHLFSLTKEGYGLSRQFAGEGFGTWMISCENSRAYRRFCQLAFGSDRCQFDMMTPKQFEKLLEILGLGAGDSVLDLGCGTGSVSAAIAELTGASVVGMDFSASAIQFAQEKYHALQPRLSFQVMDMDALTLQPASFDAVVMIDSIYFVRDLSQTLCGVKHCLREKGQIAIFYDSHIAEGEPKELLLPDQTPLAKALRQCDLSFTFWDFTADEIPIWEGTLQAAAELRDEFAVEGSLGILEDREYEAKAVLEFHKGERISRYLYQVR